MAKAEITIGARRYSLNCAPGQEARLEELGARFDQRVRELTEVLGDLGPERLFLAAGISLLDELDALSAGPPGSAIDERLRHLETRAASVLAEAAQRIDRLSRRVDEAG